MKLKWYAVPAVCNLDLEIGGLLYTACPFNGWYATNEIVRNLADEDRYNVLEHVAICMGLDTTRHDTLWRDEALVVLGAVVLHSFSHAGYGIVDHHTLIRNFFEWYQGEMKHRGYCPGNWKWLIPPFAASQSPAYMMLNKMTEYTLKPAFVYGRKWKFLCEQHFGPSDKAAALRQLRIVARACKFVGKLKHGLRKSSPTICIAYASVSGNTQRYAGQLAAIASAACKVQLVDLAESTDSVEFARHIRECTLLVVLSSTYGNGEVPNQGKALESWLEKGTLDLDGRAFVVLGFGSKKYPKFCEACKRFDNLLEQCKGRRLHPVGLCDAATESVDFRNWAVSTLSAIRHFCETRGRPEKWAQMANGMQAHFSGTSTLKEPSFRIEVLSDEEVVQKGRLELLRSHSDRKRVDNSQVAPQESKKSQWMFASVMETMNLFGNPTSENFDRSTTLVKLDISKCGRVPYKPGDHLMMEPDAHFHRMDEITSFCQEMCFNGHGLNPEMVFVVRADRDSLCKEQFGLLRKIIGDFITPIKLFCSVADIMSPMSSQACLQLSQCASRADKARLKQLAADVHLYNAEIQINGLKWIHLFENYPTLKQKVDFSDVLKHMPLNHARYYSISSSKAYVGDELHLTVGRRVYCSEDEVEHLGLASNFLTLVKKGELIKFKIQTASDFHLPLRPEAPVIMIATGTGIAPFRGFWQERLALHGGLHPMTLVLGCRSQVEAEALYMSELKEAEERGVLSFFHAYSREPEQPKKYVVDVLREHAAHFQPLLGNRLTHVYFCGGAGVAFQVKETLSVIDAPGFRAIELEDNYHEDIFGLLKLNR